MIEFSKAIFFRTFCKTQIFAFVFAVLFFVPILPAQNRRAIDSLTQVAITTKQDTVRIMAWRYLAGKYDLSNPDSAVYFATQAIELATKINWTKGIAASNNALGTAYFRKGEYDIALKYQNIAKVLWDSLKDQKGIALAHEGLGIINWRMGNYPVALDHYTTSIKIDKVLNDSSALAKTTGNIGLIYAETKEYDKALQYYMDAIAMYERLNKRSEVARMYGNMGIVFYNQGAVALAANESVKADSLIKVSANYYRISLRTAEAAGDKMLMGRQYSNIGINYWQLGFRDSAFYYMNRSLEISQSIGDKNAYANTLGNIGSMYFELEDYNRAEDYLQRSLVAATEAHSAGDRSYALQTLATVYEKKGDWKLAHEYYQKYVSLKDSMFSESKSKEIGRIEARADYDRKEAIAEANHKKELAVAEEKEKQQLIISIASVAGLIIVLLFSIFLYNRFLIIRKQKKVIEVEKQRSEELLLNILPAETAAELKEHGKSDARLINHVTVLFTDFKGFTSISETLSPQELVSEINECFSAFDRIMEKYGIEKIKTIGDAYMAAGGLPTPNQTHALDVVGAACDIRQFMQDWKDKKQAEGKLAFEIRIGVHTGPVVAGIVGIKKFQYDIWGDTVNTASRMESSGEPGEVNISEATYALVKDKFICTSRGKIAAKNKGEMEMFFVRR
jgi:adenylate cyclase